MIGLLAVTGARVGKRSRWTAGDVDIARGLRVILHTNFGKSRALVVHPSTVDALRG
ncbi:MAG: hypothetical protein ACRDSZ_10180 [Pseudonocardiaceae bacterium]